MFCSLIAAYFDAASGHSAETVTDGGEVVRKGREGKWNMYFAAFCFSLIKSRTASGQRKRSPPLSHTPLLSLFLPFYLSLSLPVFLSPKRASVVSLMRHKEPNAFLLLASSVDAFVVAFAASVGDSLPHCVLCWLKSHTYDKGLFIESRVLAISRAV